MNKAYCFNLFINKLKIIKEVNNMKGYPKSRFDIINQTQIQEITVDTINYPIALFMQPYTSDKGTENWEVIGDFEKFSKEKGGISFLRHGQAQLTVAEVLRSGGYVLGKRMLSDDAALANVTVKARVVKVDSVSYVYFYTKSGINIADFEEACDVGYGDFDSTATPAEGENSIDIPLFTVTPMGRGASGIFFRISPEYASSRSKNTTSYLKYAFDIFEDGNEIESIVFTMNPEIIIDDIAQAMNPKIKSNSGQVRVKLYEDGMFKLIDELAKTAVDAAGEPIPAAELVNLDFINACDRKGESTIGGIVTINQADEEQLSQWEANKPADITTPYDLADAVGIPLTNGSYGTMGVSPVTNTTEYENMLLSVFGKNTESPLFSTKIYDLDAYKIDAIFDCNFPMTVKNAIVDLVDFRGDMVYLCDLGTKANTLARIIDEASKITLSKYTALYHNYMKIIDPFTKKEITVTMPYLLVNKMVKHVAKGVGIPFAGIANDLTFNTIIENSINFLPVEIPGINQKQELVDMNINYLNIYDGVPVMETMYTNDGEYSQLSFLHNIMAVQEIIKVIRARCPQTRYTFLDGDDLEQYIDDVEAIVKQYSTNFKSISVQYMADEKYESNNIFYAVLKVQFKNFIQEEYFKIIAIA